MEAEATATATARVAILNHVFTRGDEAVNTARVSRHQRTFTDYASTDRLGTFRPCPRVRVSALGNRFARLVESSVAQVMSEERQRQAARAIHTYEELVTCLFDRGVTVARATLDPVYRADVEGDRRMTLVRNAISAVWTLLDVEGWYLEPFQWRYLQCFLLGMFRRLIGSETNRYVHKVLRLLHLATPEMIAYDPKFPDPRVADEMSRIFETMSRKMWVIVAPRRSGKSVSVDLAIALTMVFAEGDVPVLLMANTLDTARLHLDPVYGHLKTMQALGLVHDVRISKNDRDVTIVFLREKRKSTLHIIAGAPHVSIFILFFLLSLSFLLLFCKMRWQTHSCSSKRKRSRSPSPSRHYNRKRNGSRLISIRVEPTRICNSLYLPFPKRTDGTWCLYKMPRSLPVRCY